MQTHFSGHVYPYSEEVRQLKAHCLTSLAQLRTSLIRPVHTLAYLLDFRYTQVAEQLSQVEVAAAIKLMLELAAAQDTRSALVSANETDPSKLPKYDARVTAEGIFGEYTDFRSRTDGSFVMDATLSKRAVRNQLRWWQTWSSHAPALTAIVQKVMTLPLSFAPCERSFWNAGNIQGRLRTRLSHHRLHQLLYVNFKSRALTGIPESHSIDATVHGPEDAGGGDVDEGDGSAANGGERLDLAGAAAIVASIVDEEWHFFLWQLSATVILPAF